MNYLVDFKDNSDDVKQIKGAAKTVSTDSNLQFFVFRAKRSSANKP